MSNLKDKVIDEIIEIEGGYVNDPSDSGGETKYGITKAVALNNGYHGAIKDMPKSVAQRIYRKKYWDSMSLDDIELFAGQDIARELADTAVNMGVYRSSLFLQRSLNVLNGQGRLYMDIAADGVIGYQTKSALAAYCKIRESQGRKVLLSMLNSLQGAFYVELAERREKDERFIFGWFSKRVI